MALIPSASKHSLPFCDLSLAFVTNYLVTYYLVTAVRYFTITSLLKGRGIVHAANVDY